MVNGYDRFHHYVSADPTVSVEGTDLLTVPMGFVPIERVLVAVSVATRTPAEQVLGARGPARSLFLAAARELSGASSSTIGRFAGVSGRAVRAHDQRVPVGLAALAADPRVAPFDAAWFAPLWARRRRRAA